MIIKEYINRNLLCFCGSNISVKDCCYKNKKYNNLDLSSLIAVINGQVPHNEKNDRTICAFNYNFGKCDNLPIGSHSISRSSNLTPLSTNDPNSKEKTKFLYTFFDYSFKFRVKQNDKTTFQKVSDKVASVFYGACDQHDKIYLKLDDTFENVYKDYFWISQRQILRSFYYAKKNIRIFSLLQKYLSSINENYKKKLQYPYLPILKSLKTINHILDSANKEHEIYDTLTKKYFASLNENLTIENDKLLYCVSINLDVKLNYNSSSIQFLDQLSTRQKTPHKIEISFPNQTFFVSILTNKNRIKQNSNYQGSTVVFTCLNTDIDSIKYINNIIENKTKIIDSLMFYCLNSDNSFYNLDYINNLPYEEKQFMIDSFNENIKRILPEPPEEPSYPDLNIACEYEILNLFTNNRNNC